MSEGVARPERLTDPDTHRVRTVKRLSGRAFRVKSGLIRVEGPQAVAELCAYSPSHVQDVYIGELATGRRPDVVQLALETTQWLHECTDAVVDHMSADGQGFVAVASRRAIDGDLDRIAEQVLASSCPVVICPQTQDPGNAGTLIRLADAFGAAGVVMCKGSADPAGPKVIRASAGSVFHLPIVSGVTFDEACEAFARRGIAFLGADGKGQVGLPRLSADRGPVGLSSPHAWVLGNEAHGLTEDQLEACTATVSIPMTGKAESLNIAAAAALCLYASQQARQ